MLCLASKNAGWFPPIALAAETLALMTGVPVAQGWSRDLSEDAADEIRNRCNLQGDRTRQPTIYSEFASSRPVSP
jgi:hypothetical protein